MAQKRKNIAYITLLTFSCLLALFTSCKEKSLDGMLVLTEIEGSLQNKDYVTGNSWRYLPKARIVSINYSNPNESLQVLTEDFFSACAPKISYDGLKMLFAAQQKENDIWQIWEMNLANLKAKQITNAAENCIDPDYLPGDRMVFSKSIQNSNFKSAQALFTSNLDGTEETQITYNPHTYFAPKILKDGRIASISKQLYPNEKEGSFMVMRPDGTKQELFYQTASGNHINSSVWETDKNEILFIESDTLNKATSNIIAINYNRPLHSRVNLSSEINGSFYSVSEIEKGKLLTTYRSSENENLALYEFDFENKKLGNAIYKDDKYQIVEAVAVKKHKRPRKLPSEVNADVKVALMVCQDINYSSSDIDENPASKATQLEILGMDSSMGVLNAEKDGSFYIRILADTPFRIQTLDEMGNVVNGPGSWLYLRPNERRGCVGCHQDNEMAPKNSQPLAVRKDPIVIPMHGEDVLLKHELKTINYEEK